MNPMRFVVNLFVNTFGITRPSPAAEAAAARYIAFMLLTVVILLAVAGWLVHAAFSH